jgi:acetyl esterase/lipase
MSIITACPKNEGSTSEPQLPAQTLLNVAYGNDSLQKMDIYLPAGRTAARTKSIILIHGGGWNGGGKYEFATYIDSFRKRMPDYAIFNLNYRLVNGGNLFPAQEQDIRAALDFISKNADQQQVNKDQLVLLGASAGGHLALLQAYKYPTPKIKAVIDFFGPTDLVAMYQHPWHPLVPYALQMVTGTTPAADPELYRQSSPINFVNSHSAPTLIFHGEHDNVVNISQSKALKNKLEQAGVRHDLIVYPRERHGWQGTALTNSFDHIETFLKANGQ